MGEGRADIDLLRGLPLLQQKIKAVTVAIGVRAGEARGAGGGVAQLRKLCDFSA